MCESYNPAADCEVFRKLEAELIRSKGVKRKEGIQGQMYALKAKMRRFGYDTRGKHLLVNA